MKITKQKLKQIIKEEEGFPASDELKKGRFTEYCKREGFDGPGIGCAEKAMDSDDASVRGMASFYMNTVKPKGKDASDVAEENLKLTKESLSAMIQDVLEEEKDWIQRVDKEIKKDGTKGVCTGKKFGGPTCRPGTPRYNLAKVFRNMNEVTADAQKSAEYESLSAMIQEAIEEYGYRGRPTKASKQKAKVRWNAKVAQLVKDQGGHIPMDMWTGDLAHAYNQRKSPIEASEMVLRHQDELSETTMASGAIAGYAGKSPKKK